MASPFPTNAEISSATPVGRELYDRAERAYIGLVGRPSLIEGAGILRSALAELVKGLDCDDHTKFIPPMPDPIADLVRAYNDAASSIDVSTGHTAKIDSDKLEQGTKILGLVVGAGRGIGQVDELYAMADGGEISG